MKVREERELKLYFGELANTFNRVTHLQLIQQTRNRRDVLSGGQKPMHSTYSYHYNVLQLAFVDVFPKYHVQPMVLNFYESASTTSRYYYAFQPRTRGERHVCQPAGLSHHIDNIVLHRLER
jgi:hypothetical protein